MTVSFGARLERVFASTGRLCVGIDPHAYLLGEWGLGDTAEGLREFGLRVVEAAHDRVGIVKPQVAFFERHGAAGYAALEDVLASARAAGLVVIADVKRGDVGSSVTAYGEAWLTPGGPLEADAMTISAFQGVGSIRAPHDLALSAGKGLFVLAATSNPEAAAIQAARIDNGLSVARSIVDDVQSWNEQEHSSGGEGGGGRPNGLGSTGVVIGATIDMAGYGIDAGSLRSTPILAPGFGHQGAHVRDAAELFGAASAGLIVSASRSILAAGRDGVAPAIDAQVRELTEVFS